MIDSVSFSCKAFSGWPDVWRTDLSSTVHHVGGRLIATALGMAGAYITVHEKRTAAQLLQVYDRTSGTHSPRRDVA